MKFEKRYRKDMPETVGETDRTFDLLNYSQWLENRIDILESSLECVRDNTLNPARTMTVLGLENSMDACNRIANAYFDNLCY